MNQTIKFLRIATLATISIGIWISNGAVQKTTAATAQLPVEALLYSTMPSYDAHRSVMAMDGDATTYYKTAYGMDDGDDFLVMLSRPIPVRSITIATGDPSGQDLLTNAAIEVSSDGTTFKKAAEFGASGMGSASLAGKPVLAFRIKLDPGTDVPSLVIREITIDSPDKITHVQWGPGRPFSDISQAPELAKWAATAQQEMEDFWPDADALLYSPGFIPPNMVNVVYRTGPDVTPVAATGGGVMTVNSKWCDAHPEDTGLTVHEMAHVVQAFASYDPVWLIEGEADYIRWVKFEPQNFTYHINPVTATYHDAYRTTAAFLGWCELHYDSCLVTKLNRAVRSGTYKNDLFKTYCGKDVDTLWSEFLDAYEANPATVLTPPTPLADQPRTLPTVKPGSSTPVDLSAAFNTTGIINDGQQFALTDGIDGGGAAYSGDLVGTSLTAKDVQFNIGLAGAPDVISCSGNDLTLPSGSYSSIWILGTAVQGDAMSEPLVVAYTDGSTAEFSQNFSDWYQSREFPGETIATKTTYRDMSTGDKDARPFNIYAYGFALDNSKTVKSLTLPNDQQVKILAVSLAN